MEAQTSFLELITVKEVKPTWQELMAAGLKRDKLGVLDRLDFLDLQIAKNQETEQNKTASKS